ncbi:MAG TPA: SIMPL domain-containing protein [Candidatus Nitrosotalea sp.]|nr:SIMPL domain-containing protein [Candidatus Nitrosotalea sp.]
MTKLTNALTMAAIAIVSATILTGMHSWNDDAFGQQYPYMPPEQNTTSVTGTATTTVTPNLVIIDLGVDTQAKTALDALGQNAQAMNATATAIEKLGITSSEISTNNFNIQPVYNETGPYPPYNQYKNELVGYKVSNTLEIKTGKLGLAGNILDTAVSAGANRVDSVTFTLSPAQLQSVQNGLISQAVLDAQSRAQQALAPLNEKIVGVKSVNLSEFHMAEPMAAYGRMTMGAAAPAVQTPIFTSNQDITTSVDVTFLIGAK